MRLSIEIKAGAEVRDDSVTYGIGKVLAVVDHGDGRTTLVVQLDEAKVKARLAEKRGAF